MSNTTPGARSDGALLLSVRRTVVPKVVAAVVTYLFGVELGWLHGIADAFGVSEGQITAGLTLFAVTVVDSVYYTVVRVIEQTKPKFGWLLGAAKQPVYGRVTDAVRDRLRPDEGQANASTLWVVLGVVGLVLLVLLLVGVL